MPNAPLTIGRLSALTGVHVETIRYYERIGLMPEPPRSEGGHRHFDVEHRKRLAFIRRCRELGFAIPEIDALLRLVDGGTVTCAEVHDITRSHLESVQDKIIDLKRLEGVLETMIEECRGGTVPDCPVIDALFRTPR